MSRAAPPDAAFSEHQSTLGKATVGMLHGWLAAQERSCLKIVLGKYPVGSDHVVIPGHHDRDTGVDQVIRMYDQPFEARQFIREFRTRLRIAVGQVNASDENTTNRCFQVSSLPIVVITGKV